MNRESARNLIKSYLLDYVRTITKKGRKNSGSNMFIFELQDFPQRELKSSKAKKPKATHDT